MFRSSTRTLAGLVLTLGLPLAAAAATPNPSPHRVVENGIGNCIFSSSAMPFDQDATFAPKTSFQAPDRVYARCYYPKTVGEFRSEGRISSQLRGNARYPAAYNRRLQFSPPNWQYSHTVSATEKEHGRDQAYLYIFPDRGCDMRKKPRTGECIDMANEVRNLAESQKAGLPYTATVCLHIDFDVVNERVPNPENRLELIDKNQFVTIAKGCFDYTVSE